MKNKSLIAIFSIMVVLISCSVLLLLLKLFEGVLYPVGSLPTIEWIRTLATIMSAASAFTLGLVAFLQNVKLNKQNEQMQLRNSESLKFTKEKELSLQQEALLSGYYTFIKFMPFGRLVENTKNSSKRKKIKPEDVKRSHFLADNIVDKEQVINLKADFNSRDIFFYFEEPTKNPMSQLSISSIVIESISEDLNTMAHFTPIGIATFNPVPFFEEISINADKIIEKRNVIRIELITDDCGANVNFWQTITNCGYWRITLNMTILSVFNVAINGEMVAIVKNRDNLLTDDFPLFSSYFIAKSKPYEFVNNV